MEIKVVWEDGLPVAILPLGDGRHEPIGLSPLQTLGSDLDRFLKPLLAKFSLIATTSARLRLRHLVQLGEAIHAGGHHNLPMSAASWQSLILGVHHFVHTREDRQQSLETRHLGIWKSCRKIFKILVHEGIIPVSVHIPPVLAKLIQDQRAEQLIGESDPVEVDRNFQVTKLLMPVSLSRTDAAYLDEIRDGLLIRRQALLESLTDYWKKLRLSLEFGRNLRNSLSEERFVELTVDAATGESKSPDPTISLDHLAAYLIYLERNCDGSPHRSRGNLNATRSERLQFSLPVLSSWPIAALLPSSVNSTSDSRASFRFLWTLLGRLSPQDVSVIVPLLIILNPQWTPIGLSEATITDRDGKLYLDLDDDGLGFEVEKHRAKAMKRSVLCELSEEILTTVLEHSTVIRQKLLSEKHPYSNRLFLPYGKAMPQGCVSVTSPPADPSKFIAGTSGRKNYWLGNFYPALGDAGLSAGEINCRKIRATEGVLEWFRTKSLRAAAKKIGNSERVVLEHYIPAPIIRAWNTRCVRRFQNLWLTVAAANEPFLLEVTDLPSLADLNAFVTDLLQLHGAKSSPLAAELHLRLAAAEVDAPSQNSGHLHIALSTVSLSALYRYSAAASQAGVPIAKLQTIGSVGNSSAAALVQLADLLQMQLPQDRNPSYRKMHEEAMLEAANPLKLEPWTRLFRNQ